jgi:hypothetical protein
MNFTHKKPTSKQIKQIRTTEPREDRMVIGRGTLTATQEIVKGTTPVNTCFCLMGIYSYFPMFI